MAAGTTNALAWKKIVAKAFPGNQQIRTGKPNCLVSAGVPDSAAPVGALCWDKNNGDAYICTVASGTWVKINA